ncbi:MAG TPA: NrfD/PsrC family molybdoenzyme membrane anchor subunit [Candidatus Acidoferrales bacterium]|nr:NrfD/PsrC family molybdoenzyme membrane anchor subunit [Candidatus Acidoferrales bacterium]
MLRVLTHTSWRFYLCFGMFSVVALWGLYGYILQLRHGLIVTGMRDQISWGLYISNFVFFTGISYGGTLISAILRVTDSGWRHPITRLSEAITVFALCVGGPMVIIDLGRPDRMGYLFIHGRIQSAILWDVIAVSTYLAGCALYLYLPMIPDLALLSEMKELAPWRRKLYRTLAFGWTDTPAEKHLLEKCISRMAILMIMLAVSVHTVVSWIFAMTLRPGWNSSIFGPYFVMGAIYSGTAAVVLSMYILLRVLHLEDYLKPVHFRNLGLLLITFALLYLYFTINEYLTSVYKVEGPDRVLLHQLFFGDYAVMMWVTQAMFIAIPLLMIAGVLTLKRLRRFTPSVVALASVLVVLGAGAKRYLIVVPTLTAPFLPKTNRGDIPFNPPLPFNWVHYRPTWVEWAITLGGSAAFLLMYMLFTKLFPMVSMWETRHDEAQVEPAVAPAPQPAPQRLGSIATTVIVLIAFLLFGAGLAQAGQKRQPKAPQATTLSLEWKQEATPAPTNDGAEQAQPSAPEASGVDGVYGRLFGWLPVESRDRTQGLPPSFVITATLLGAKGQPLAYQVVGLSLKTSFGKLDYGSRPTNAEGKAQFSMQDRRYGQYPVEGTYDGGAEFAAAHAVTSVDFGPRPEPSLPSQGVLITPYATAWIGLPFLGFFGLVWAVFIYIGVYLLWFRLPQIRKQQAQST